MTAYGGNGSYYGGPNLGFGNGTYGVIFSFDPSTSTYKMLHGFDHTNGARPLGSLVQASNGILYGMTHDGGSGNYLNGNGNGVIFSFDPSTSTYTKLKDLDGTNGRIPYGSLIQASNGKLYGMTCFGGSYGNDYGDYGYGVIFSFDPSTSTYTKLKDFDFTNGAHPIGSLVQASNGKLYGMTERGGSNDGGVIFSFDPSTSTYTKVKEFPYDADGRWPRGSLIQANNGKLYGMTPAGGSYAGGVIFSFDPSTSTFTKLKDYDGINGTLYGSFMQASNGKLYAMTQNGENYSGGVIFSFDPSTSTYTKVKDFDSGTWNSLSPHGDGSLMQAGNGKLYGMTCFGGSSSNSNIVIGGGNHGNGVIFSFDPSSSVYTKLMNLDSNGSGTWASGTIMQASNGKLYGMTKRGGTNGSGAIFSFDPCNSTYTKLIDFDGINGAEPSGSLVQGSNGKLYGITNTGGSYGNGVIFSLDPSTSTYTKLIDFDGTNGSGSFGSLMQASDGKFYFMEAAVGASMFSFDPTTSTITRILFGSNTAFGPKGNLIQASDGKLYGTVILNINNNEGVIFSYDPSTSAYADLYDFTGVNGRLPFGSLMQASNGKLYGMTNAGGTYDYGVIFSYDPSSSAYTKLKDFDGANGRNPYGSLVQASDGKLYGMTSGGGSNDAGVVFSFDPLSSTYTKLKDLIGNNGGNPGLGSAFIEVPNSGSNCTAPAVSIVMTSGTNPTCAGQSVTFTATPANGGISPLYQWKVNGNNVGNNSPTYASTTLTNGQVVSCVMTSSITNANPPTATSNSITLTVNSYVTPTVTIAINAGANPTCTGQLITFTATPTNGGTLPTYQWKVNGNNAGTNSSTYATTNLINGQIVSCVITSNATCANPTTASSNSITMNVSSTVTPSVSVAITSGVNPTCTGQSITFSATSTYGGTSPTYQWKVNGINAGANSSTFTTNSLTNGQVVSCMITSNLSCANPTTASSNNITMAINPAAAPAITITQTSCTGTTVGFTANISNGGASPSYLWSFTGTGTASNFSGPNFTLSNAANGAQVQCRLTSNATCVNPIQVSSSPLVINCINNCSSVSPATLNFQVYPNPVSQNAVISFSLCSSIHVSIGVFNITGQQIAILEDRVLNSGDLTIPWNTTNVADGVYFARLQTVNYSIAKKIVVIH